MTEIYNYGKRKSNHYVSAKELFEEYNNSCVLGKCSDQLLKYFQRIAKGFSRCYKYTNKSDLDAVINYAVAEAWRKWDTYDPKKTNNIFSYYTTMISNDMKIHYNQLTKGKSVNISIESLFTPKE